MKFYGCMLSSYIAISSLYLGVSLFHSKHTCRSAVPVTAGCEGAAAAPAMSLTVNNSRFDSNSPGRLPSAPHKAPENDRRTFRLSDIQRSAARGRVKIRNTIIRHSYLSYNPFFS